MWRLPRSGNHFSLSFFFSFFAFSLLCFLQNTKKKPPRDSGSDYRVDKTYTRRIEMKSWNTAVGVRRTQGTTSSWLHPFSYFFFLTSSLFFVFCILYFYENNKWASPGVIYSIASLSPIYGLLFLFIFICFSFVSFIFQAPCQTVVNSLVNASGTYTQYTHPRVSIRSGGWSPFTFFLAIRFRLFLSTFLFRRPVRERIDDVVIVIYCRRLVVGTWVLD